METVNNNRLIVEFMGVHEISSNVLKNAILKDLTYDSDWNDLMPVVLKIKSIYDETDRESDFWTNLLLFIRNEHTIFDLKIGSPKELVFKRCLYFIQWYNEQAKT